MENSFVSELAVPVTGKQGCPNYDYRRNSNCSSLLSAPKRKDGSNWSSRLWNLRATHLTDGQPVGDMVHLRGCNGQVGYQYVFEVQLALTRATSTPVLAIFSMRGSQPKSIVGNVQSLWRFRRMLLMNPKTISRFKPSIYLTIRIWWNYTSSPTSNKIIFRRCCSTKPPFGIIWGPFIYFMEDSDVSCRSGTSQPS